MWGLLRDLIIYVTGGITFLPLLLLVIFVHGYFTLPHALGTPQPTPDPVQDTADDGKNIQKGSDVPEKLRKPQEKEIGGYFAVCREWIPGGVNGKPPERTTPAGEVIADESPSVYQSMYRSLFDRKLAPTLEVPKNASGKPLKRASNVFYVVLRHGHLMLYDDSEQVEVRYVISLAYHDVEVYGGGDEIPEGELWIKRNAIRLSRKAPVAVSLEIISKPFFLFSDNCSDKEDFYFSILQHQDRDATEEHPPPLVQHFELKHIIKLVQTLHSSEEHLQTRWFNALLGRLFLGVYKTPEVEQFIRTKITKKISRVKKPSFLSGIKLQKIDLGESAPFVTNPRLKDLTVDGDCCVEADVRYDGKFRIEIATTAKVDLGTRFKAREFDLVLAITVKKLEGHAMMRFKPTPSNRLWYTFEKMPRMELQIEPIVGSRQITYGVLLRAIESRIREVFAETLVVPHWDDSPIFSTLDQHFRGGIWVHELQHFSQTETVIPDEMEEAQDTESIQSPSLSNEDLEGHESNVKSPMDKPMSRLFQRKPVKSPTFPPTAEAATTAATSAFQKSEPPHPIRSKSFAPAASPITSPDMVESDLATEASLKITRDAAGATSDTFHRQPTPPSVGPAINNESASMEQTHSSEGSSRSTPDMFVGRKSSGSSRDLSISGIKKSGTSNSAGSGAAAPSRLQNVAKTLTPLAKKQQSLGSAALAAKSWGWKTLTKGRGAPSPTATPPPDITQPMGRGQPLPPPGQPLPHPDKLKSSTPPTPPALPPRKSNSRSASYDAGRHLSQPKSAPPHIVVHRDRGEPEGDGVMVVEAPVDSGPPSPAFNDDDSYGEFMDNVPSESEQSPRGVPGALAESIPVEEAHEGHVAEATHAAQPVVEETQPAPSEPAPDAAEGVLAEEAHTPMPQDFTPSSREMTEEEALHAAWAKAEEEEARSKSVWIEEPEMP